MQSRQSRFAKNALSNIVRGSATALSALLLPAALIRILPSGRYNVWFLIVQLSTYTSFLDFGIQTAIGRFVAQATEREDHDYRSRIVSTGFFILLLLCGIAILGMLLVAAFLPEMFTKIPPEMHRDSRIALMVLGASTAIGLPASAFIGVFVGLQRYEVPAVLIGTSRLASAALVVAYVYLFHGGLIGMASVLAVANLATYAIEYVTCRKMVRSIHVAWKHVGRETASEIVSYSFSLAVWSVAMIMVSGVDTTIVGFTDFHAVAFFAAAASVVAVISSLQTSIFGILVPEAAVLSVREDAAELGRLLMSATRYGMYLLLAVGLPLLIWAPVLMKSWLGPTVTPDAIGVLEILLIANIIRLSGTPYSTLLIGTGQQQKVLLSPLLEGIANLTISIALSLRIGAIGVAYGTLAGSVVGVLCNCAYNMRRTEGIVIDIKLYCLSGLLKPVVFAIPLFLAVLLSRHFSSGLALMSLSALALAVFLLGLWSWAITDDERHGVAAFTSKVRRVIIRA